MRGFADGEEREALLGSHIELPNRVRGDRPGRRAGDGRVVQLDEQRTTTRRSSSPIVQYCVRRVIVHESEVSSSGKSS